MQVIVSGDECSWLLFISVGAAWVDNLIIEPSAADLGQVDNNFVGFGLVDCELYDCDERFGFR